MVGGGSYQAINNYLLAYSLVVGPCECHAFLNYGRAFSAIDCLLSPSVNFQLSMYILF